MASSSSCSVGSPSSLTQRHRPPPSLSPSCIRYVVLGAGFSGLYVARHMLKQSSKDSNIRVDIYDEVGIGGGGSGVSGGLLHPYSPKAKLLWRAADCRTESLNLLSAAVASAAPNSDGQCQLLEEGTVFSMSKLVKELCASGSGVRELHLHKGSVHKLLDLEGEYQAVIVCLGAKADMLPELCGRLPLRLCRGVVAHLQLPDDIGEAYPSLGPLILSDAWLAVQRPRCLYMGSTWEWKSRNSSPNVFADEAREALKELLPTRAGLRAMPPLTPHGSLCLLGCVHDIVDENRSSNHWLFGGLGSRGLLYHGWLGKLMAQDVLSCNEELFPHESTSWKKMNYN